jgi:UBX domain
VCFHHKKNILVFEEKRMNMDEDDKQHKRRLVAQERRRQHSVRKQQSSRSRATKPDAIASSSYVAAAERKTTLILFRIVSGDSFAHDGATTSSSALEQEFYVNDPVSSMRSYLVSHGAAEPFDIVLTFPSRVLTDSKQTLRELGLEPRAAVFVRQHTSYLLAPDVERASESERSAEMASSNDERGRATWMSSLLSWIASPCQVQPDRFDDIIERMNKR